MTPPATTPPATAQPSTTPPPTSPPPEALDAEPAGTDLVATRLAEPGDRGSLRVADRVFTKIAAKAASEVEHTVALPSRRIPGRAARPVQAQVVRSGRLVQVRVAIAVEYPRSVVQVTRAVRERVRDAVTRMCNAEVRDVDVVVRRLVRPPATRRVQ